MLFWYVKDEVYMHILAKKKEKECNMKLGFLSHGELVVPKNWSNVYFYESYMTIWQKLKSFHFENQLCKKSILNNICVRE